MRRTYWVFTDQSLFELVVANEDRDVWKIYLEKEQFDTALRYAKVGTFCCLPGINLQFGIDRTTKRPSPVCASK